MTENEIKNLVDKVLSGSLSTKDKRDHILGRKGIITKALRDIKTLSVAKRKSQGQFLNSLRQEMELKLQDNKTTQNNSFDLSAPAKETVYGAKHPINLTIDSMVNIFSRFGFEVVMGPEIVTDENNFGLLNFPDDHPARDTQDSFLIKDLPELLMRTQTSAMQIPAMKKRTPPMRVIVPGKTFRREADATHQPMFNQLEGFIVDESVTFSDLKGLLEYFIQEFFGPNIQVRFRPHYFAFTEPSAEVDILWSKKNGKEKWLEILGCGVIHPAVLKNAGIDPKKYQGVAFGVGIERPFMLRHGVNDMRLLYNNDEEFLNQFSSL